MSRRCRQRGRSVNVYISTSDYILNNSLQNPSEIKINSVSLSSSRRIQTMCYQMFTINVLNHYYLIDF